MTRDELAIVHLMEEAAEVVQICSKILRFGLEDKYPLAHKSNKERLAEELADVLLSADICLELGLVGECNRDQDSIKQAKGARYLELSKQLQRLSERAATPLVPNNSD